MWVDCDAELEDGDTVFFMPNGDRICFDCYMDLGEDYTEKYPVENIYIYRTEWCELHDICVEGLILPKEEFIGCPH